MASGGNVPLRGAGRLWAPPPGVCLTFRGLRRSSARAGAWQSLWGVAEPGVGGALTGRGRAQSPG